VQRSGTVSLSALLFTDLAIAGERGHLLTSCLMYNASRKKLGPLTAIDLFAGAGGLTLAAQRSGIEVRAAVEVDSHACATYRKNLVDETTGYPNLIEGDINELDWAELLKKAGLKLRECSLLLGGPPCQGFSTHRIKNAGVDDPRNELLVRYFECVAAIKPKAFLVENVPGLLWERHASYLQRFYSLATEAGYVVFEPVVLNSRDFGVPQNRKRVFLLGFRKDINVHLCWPPPATHYSPDSPEVKKHRKPKWRTAASVFSKRTKQDDPNQNHMNHSESLIEVFRSTPVNGGSRHESGRTLECHKAHNGHKDVYGRIDPRQPGPTMTTACVNPSKGRFVHPTEHHGITPRQAARFQTFPDHFYFEGGLMSAGKQIGNAVPVQQGQQILRLVRDALLNSSDNGVVKSHRRSAPSAPLTKRRRVSTAS
jgi:DNA (cytosine-5)-methyltransferase 1